MLAARELHRGTLKLLRELESFRHLGITPPPLRLLLNQVTGIRVDTRMIIRGLRETFAGAMRIFILHTVIPDRLTYVNSPSTGLHRNRIQTPRPRKTNTPKPP